MTPEQWTQGIVIGFAVILAMAGAFWWGYEVRARLSEKLEFFRVTNRQWHAYDRDLKASREGHVPLRAELHDFSSRQSDR